ncbi:hypothetical protein K525DRAFT_265778 [Schizophyllum commune Loenen D]|nr:hypothetical protein K525DRAFT_265778 [Schizophyllum commune Loenen D]
MGSFTLVDEETKEVIASYERHSALSSQSNKVHIEEKGLPIVEELLAALIYMISIHQRRAASVVAIAPVFGSL